MSTVISPDQVRSFRLTRHHLDRRAPRRQLLRVVKDMIGAQAQVPSAAAVSLWSRVEGLERRMIDEALYKRKSMTRTWCLRGTAHLIAREDRLLLVNSLGKEIGGLYRVMQRHGYTKRKLKTMGEAVLDALEDGPLTREQIKKTLTTRFPREGREVIGSWGGILRILSQDGRIVFGPPLGNQSTFARADRWWPGRIEPEDRVEPLSDLLLRYLRAYGPATLSDFAYWTGLTVKRTRTALEKIGEDLVELEIAGKRSFLHKRDLSALRRVRPSEAVRLLPNFDVYLLGHRDKALIIEERHYKAIFRAAGWVSAVVLKGGRVVGTWTTTTQGKSLRIEVDLHETLRRSDRAILREEASSLGRFLGAGRTILEA